MYDAIIVGARCAGSPTAMLLAHKGYRVLLVDRMTFPSDSVRAHFVRHDGILKLKEWGLLDTVAASNCPAVAKQTTDYGDFPLTGYPPMAEGIQGEYAPRRYILDKILVDAAVSAGAELREAFTVDELCMDGERVTGIRGHTRTGHSITESATIVIGADGMNSLVARTVQAPKYHEHPTKTCCYYTYWQDVPVDGLEFYYRHNYFIIAVPTNDNLTLIATGWPANEAEQVRVELERRYLADFCRVPAFAAKLEGAKAVERIIGMVDLPNFFRKPYGPGWALVGDAGYHKDPLLAWGISDAFRDAALLSRALDAGLTGHQPLDEALEGYQHTRDEMAMPKYHADMQAASLEPPSPKLLALRAALLGHQDDINQFYGVNIGTVNPARFYSQENLQRIMGRAAPQIQVSGHALSVK